MFGVRSQAGQRVSTRVWLLIRVAPRPSRLSFAGTGHLRIMIKSRLGCHLWRSDRQFHGDVLTLQSQRPNKNAWLLGGRDCKQQCGSAGSGLKGRRAMQPPRGSRRQACSRPSRRFETIAKPRKSPARGSGRAQFLSFNLTNALICAIASSGTCRAQSLYCANHPAPALPQHLAARSGAIKRLRPTILAIASRSRAVGGWAFTPSNCTSRAHL